MEIIPEVLIADISFLCLKALTVMRFTLVLVSTNRKSIYIAIRSTKKQCSCGFVVAYKVSDQATVYA